MASRDYAAEFESFKADILANGGTINDENGLRAQYIFRKGVMPDSVFKRFVTGERPTKKEPVTEKKKDTTTEIKPVEIKQEEKSAEQKKEEQPAPKKKTQRERFELYKAKLEGKGIKINNEEALFEVFRSSQRGVDYNLIREFVTFPETPKKKVIKLKPRLEENKQKKEEKVEKPVIKEDKEKKKSPDLSSFEQYMADIRSQGYTITNIRALLKNFKEQGAVTPDKLEGFVEKEQPKNKPQHFLNVSESKLPAPIINPENLPAVIENTWADSWIQPLQDWCDTDKTDKGLPKRSLKTIIADNNTAVVEILPTEDYAKENPADKGANYSFKKTSENNVDITLSTPDGKPGNYEYFRRLVLDAKKNGVEVIAFNEIKTDEFRDKLLAAALEFGMQLQNAPAKINYNAPYLKDLPSAVKIKLGIHNGDLTAKGEPVKDVLDRLKEHREKVLGHEEKPETKENKTQEEKDNSSSENNEDKKTRDDYRERDREYKPRYNRDDNRNGERRPRRDRNGDYERKPRYNRDDGERRPRSRNQGDNQRRPSFQKPQYEK